jgi:hypothetical protein
LKITTVFEEKNRHPVLTGTKKKLRPFALGCLLTTASYPDLRVFGELRPDEKTIKPFP